jgi:hypothetical protein
MAGTVLAIADLASVCSFNRKKQCGYEEFAVRSFWAKSKTALD